jgi:hypothetical protein
MDPLIELIAKGGIGIVVGFIIAKWLAAAVKTLWTQSEERAKAAEKRCEEANAALVVRVQQLEDRHYNTFTAVLQATSEALKTNAHAFDKLTDIGTDKFRAIQHKERA